MVTVQQSRISNGHTGPKVASKNFIETPASAIVAETRDVGSTAFSLDSVFSHFVLVTHGRGRFAIEGRASTVEADTLLHIPAQEGVRLESSTKQNMRVCLVRYQSDGLPAEIRTRLAELGVVTVNLGDANIHQERVIRSIFQEILFEQSAFQECWPLFLQSRLTEIAIKAIRLAPRPHAVGVPVIGANSESSDRVARYALELKSEFGKHLNLAEAARRVALSPRQFTRLFRQITGQNWCKYVLDLRLKRAADVLISTDKSVLEIAFECGFEDLSHFHRSFKVAFGSPPLVYRARRQVHLPTKPARTAEMCTGFKLRGIKGWNWTTEQYLEEIPVLAGFKMNFLMECDGGLSVAKVRPSLSKEWWNPMSEDRATAYDLVIKACREHEITFCFALHPQLGDRPLIGPDAGENQEAFIQHYLRIQSLGVNWFGICLDGTSWGTAGPSATGTAHARLVNSFYQRLLANDEEARFLFRPVACSGDGTNPEQCAYLKALGATMHPDVMVFWDGDSVVTPRITRVAAESYRNLVKHRLFLWDNYPANDGNQTMHLGPLSGRDPDLFEVVDGYLSNPMHPQSRINRLPLATCADYAFSPTAYNPSRSIGHAICRLGKSADQQQTLKQLVEAYPGFIVSGGGTGTNPLRQRFNQTISQQGETAAAAFISEMKSLSNSLQRYFPSEFPDAEKTLETDLQWMEHKIS